jgi:hypothetical protein
MVSWNAYEEEKNLLEDTKYSGIQIADAPKDDRFVY